MKISIILTAYNADAYLREALDSIAAQKHRDWEAVCIDDGSADETGRILDEYASRDSRFTVVHQTNKGLAAARNVGVSLSSGDYICFCDADDMLTPYWLSNAALLIESEKYPQILRADWKFAKEPPKGFFGARTPKVLERIVGLRDCIRWAWRFYFSEGFAVLNFIRADLKPNIHFSEKLLIKEDSVMLVNLAPHLTHIVQSDYCGYFYRQSSGSLLRRERTYRASSSYLKALVEIWESQKKSAASLGLQGELKGVIQKYADNDVIDWAVISAREPKVDKRQVRLAWQALREIGAFNGRYYNRVFLYPAFVWWKLTGNESPIKLTWKLFMLVRKMVIRR